MGRDIPSRSTDHAAPHVLFLDIIELKVDELSDVANEWKYFTNTIVDQRQGREEIDDSPRDRLSILNFRLVSFSGENGTSGPTARYSNEGGGRTSSRPHQSEEKH